MNETGESPNGLHDALYGPHTVPWYALRSAQRVIGQGSSIPLSLHQSELAPTGGAHTSTPTPTEFRNDEYTGRSEHGDFPRW